MIHFFTSEKSAQSSSSKIEISHDLQSLINTFASELFSKIVSDELVSNEDNKLLREKISYLEERLQEDIQQACYRAQEQITLDALRYRLNQGEFDRHIFSESPSCTQEMRLHDMTVRF